MEQSDESPSWSIFNLLFKFLLVWDVTSALHASVLFLENKQIDDEKDGAAWSMANVSNWRFDEKIKTFEEQKSWFYFKKIRKN